MAELRKIPPVTRFLCASSLAVTIPVLMNIASPYKILFVRDLVLKKFEVCRHVFRIKFMFMNEHVHNRYGDSSLVSSSEVSLWIDYLITSIHSCAFTGGGINYIFEFVML